MNPDDLASWLAEHWDLDRTVGAWWRDLADAGLAFPTWPTGLGGCDASRSESHKLHQQLASAGVIGPPSGNGPNMGGQTLLAHATSAQKERFILPMVRGEHAWAQLFSEPGAGSDLASLATKAERDGDEFVVTGQKVWNSRADTSRFGMLLARTDPDQPKHKGISFMMIDMDQPGVEVRPLVQMNGAAEFCEVFLTDARVPLGNVIGEIHDGWAVARTTLTFERAAAGAGKTRGFVDVLAGQVGGAFNLTIRDALDAAEQARNDPRKRMEVLLNARTMIELARQTGADQNIVLRDALIRFYIDSEIYRWTGKRSAESTHRGSGPDGSIMKLKLAMLSHRSRDLSLALLGAEGMLKGADARSGGRFERVAMSAFAPSLGGGTNEIQRNIIGERTLGLPREPDEAATIPFKDLPRSQGLA